MLITQRVLQAKVLAAITILILTMKSNAEDTRCTLTIIEAPVFEASEGCSPALTGIKLGTCENDGSRCNTKQYLPPIDLIENRMCRPSTTETVTGTVSTGCAAGKIYQFQNITSCKCKEFEKIYAS